METAKKYRIYIFTMSLFTGHTTASLMAAQKVTSIKGLPSAPLTAFSGGVRPVTIGKEFPITADSAPSKPTLASLNTPRGLTSLAPRGGAERIQWSQIKSHFEEAKKNNNDEALINIKHFVSPYFAELLHKVAAKESGDIISIFEGLSGIPSVRDVLTEGVIDFFVTYTSFDTNEQKRRRFNGMIANMRIKLSQATALLTTDRISTSERAHKFFALLDKLAHNVTQSIPEKVYARLGAKGLMALTALLVGGGLAVWKGNEAYTHVKEKIVDPAGTFLNRLTEPPEVIAAKVADGVFGGKGKFQQVVEGAVEKIGKSDPDALKKQVEALEALRDKLRKDIGVLNDSIKKSSVNKFETQRITKEIQFKEKQIKALEKQLLKVLGNTPNELMTQAAIDHALSHHKIATMGLASSIAAGYAKGSSKK